MVRNQYSQNIKSTMMTPEEQQQTIQWIYQYKASDGGYEEKGTSNMYSSYYAIESLQLLNASKSQPNIHFFSWLHSLKFQEGGVQPLMSYGKPDLLSTYFALIIMRQLRQPI